MLQLNSIKYHTKLMIFRTYNEKKWILLHQIVKNDKMSIIPCQNVCSRQDVSPQGYL